MKVIVKVFLIIMLLFMISGLLFTLIYGYQHTMTGLIHAIRETGRTEKIMNLVTANKFLMLQCMGICFTLLLISILFFLNKIWDFVCVCLAYLNRQIKYVAIDFIRTEVKWILIIPLFSSVYFAGTMPVSYDEAWTYLQFTSKSPLSSLCYYPAPNNHVLHSLITNGTRYIPFLNPLLCLRISSIIVSVLSWLLCFSFIKRYYSKNSSLLITGIASMLFMSVYYSYMSRGYGLVMFFFIFSMYAAYTIILKHDQTKHWLLFGISSVLGFFTMPSFLYPFIILNTAILFNNSRNIKKQFICNVAVVVAVLILYTPIIVVNGLQSLTNNQFVKPVARMEVIYRLPDFLSNTITDIFGINYLFVLSALFLGGVMLVKNKMKFEFNLMLLFLIFPFVLLALHAVIPFSRTFNYYAIVLVFFIFIPYRKILEERSATLVLWLVLPVQIFCFFNFYYNIKKYEGFNITYHEINQKIIGNHSYFFSTVLFETNIMFENKIRGNEMTKATFHFPPIDVDADTLTGFDYYIVDKQYDFTKNKKPLYFDNRTNVYAK